MTKPPPFRSTLTEKQEKLVSFIYYNVPNVKVDEVRFLLETRQNSKIDELKRQAQARYSSKHQGSHRKRAVSGANTWLNRAKERD